MGLKNPTFTNVSLRFYGGKGGIMDEKCIRLFEVTQETNRPNNRKRPGEQIQMQNKKETELRISNTKCESQSKGPVAKENNMPEPMQSKEFNETWTWEAKSLCKDTQTKRSNKNRGLIKRQQRNPKSQSEHGRRRNIGRCQNRKLGTSQGSNENRHVAALGKMQGTFVSGQYVTSVSFRFWFRVDDAPILERNPRDTTNKSRESS